MASNVQFLHHPEPDLQPSNQTVGDQHTDQRRNQRGKQKRTDVRKLILPN